MEKKRPSLLELMAGNEGAQILRETLGGANPSAHRLDRVRNQEVFPEDELPPPNIGPGIDEPLIDPYAPVGMYAGEADNQARRLSAPGYVEPAPYETANSSDLRDPDQWRAVAPEMPVGYLRTDTDTLERPEKLRVAEGNPAVDRAVAAATRGAERMPGTMLGEQYSRPGSFEPPKTSYQGPYQKGWNPTGDIPEPPSKVKDYRATAPAQRAEVSRQLDPSGIQRRELERNRAYQATLAPHTGVGKDWRGNEVSMGEWNEPIREKADAFRRAKKAQMVMDIVREAVMKHDADSREKAFLEEVMASRFGGEGEVSEPIGDRPYDPDQPFADLQAEDGRMLYRDQYGNTQDARDYRFMQPLQGGRLGQRERANMEANRIWDEHMGANKVQDIEAQLGDGSIDMNSPVGVNNAPQTLKGYK